MSKNNLIVEKLNLKIIFLYILKYKIYYLTENLYSKLLRKFNIEKLDWDINDKNNEFQNYVTQIIEDRKVDKLSKIFFNQEKNAFQFMSKNDSFYFKEYLKIHFNFTNNLIGNLSLNQFLILVYKINIINKNKKIFYFEKNIFSDVIIKSFGDNNNFFIFYDSLKNILRFDYLKLILKIIKYSFLKKQKQEIKNHNKSICVIDSYQINKPEEIFDDKILFKKIIFASHNFFDKKFACILKELNHHVLYNFFKKIKKSNLLSENKFFSLQYIDYCLNKELYIFFFKKYKTKIFISSSIAQKYITCANSAANFLKIKSIGFSCSLLVYYTEYLGLKSFDTFVNYSALQDEFDKNKLNYKEFGYIGDYKFKNVVKEVSKIRNQLEEMKVNFVIGFFDQGFFDDKRFGLTFENAQMQGYVFLLRKLIENKNFGLLIKPKKPKLLMKFLKDKNKITYDLLHQALKTKRCIIFNDYDKDHVKNFKDIPAKIAKASDITIHDTMIAATAGFESALVGKRSVLFDYYNTNSNYIFKKNNLNIVFDNWDKLWNSLIEYKNKKQDSDIGDWSKILNKFDKFMDGKTNKRFQDFIRHEL